MRTLLVLCFLNEERYLPRVLQALAAQTRAPAALVLVDDGSTDGSPAIAEAFVQQHDRARLLRRPVRAAERDRLAGAAELRAFQWAVEQCADIEWDVVGKIDGDVVVPPDWLETIEARFEANTRLGLAGSCLSVLGPSGTVVRESSPDYHTHGATKLYRRECYEAIGPLPAILGWDMIDDIKVRMSGWENEKVAVPSGDVLQLRPVGQHDGALRANLRWGACAWGYGAHPMAVALGGVKRALRGHPPILAGIAFVCGWLLAAVRRRPRAEPAVRRELQRAQWTRFAGLMRGKAVA
jgi:glycosyltransferase involved in cell wall biosynthesis